MGKLSKFLKTAVAVGAVGLGVYSTTYYLPEGKIGVERECGWSRSTGAGLFLEEHLGIDRFHIEWKSGLHLKSPTACVEQRWLDSVVYESLVEEFGKIGSGLRDKF